MPAQPRQAIVAATLVIVSGVGSFAQFLDELGFEQPLDHRIKGAGTQADTSVCAFSDILQDGVAMAIAIGQRDEDIEGVPRQRKEIVWIWALTAESRHRGPFYPSSL